MTTNKPGLVRYPIIFKGTLPYHLYEDVGDFDARTGYNPAPEGWTCPEQAKVFEKTLRGVEFEEWNGSWLMRMGQMKGVDISELGEGEAAKREELIWRLERVKRAEADVAKKAAVETNAWLTWAKFEESDKEIHAHILVDEEKDTMHDIRQKIITVLRRSNIHIEEAVMSLWLSAVTWGNKPSKLARWVGRNAERDDGYWLGIYVYKLTEQGAREEKEANEKYEKEMRAKGGGESR